ncbi:MAG: hypothetical protein WBM17_00780 [Anaerolineales bacterium]
MDSARSFFARRSGIVFFLAAAAILFAGFCWNAWRTVPPETFDEYQIAWESFIVGRIIKTAHDGIFSAGGLPGLIGPDAAPPDIENPNYRFQYEAYNNSLPYQSFAPYQSQIGGQGMLFGVLNGLLPISHADKLALFHGLTALLSAVVLGLILTGIFRECGLLPALIALIATALSQWLTLFGKNLWWSLWAFYLPVVVVGWYLSRRDWKYGLRLRAFGLVVFAAVLAKCFFNGYEFITTTLIMMTVPFAYYSFREKNGWRPFVAGISTAAAASILAILASMAALCVQIAAVQGSLAKGVEHIVLSLLRRSYADPRIFPADYAASLTASPVDVVITYLKSIYLDLNNYIPAPNAWIANYVFQIRYLHLILLFAAASGFLLLLMNSRHLAGIKQTGAAMIAAVWFSLLAPLSWLIIFKAHSYVHTFINNLVWQMPFTLFGFALCGLALAAAARVLGNRQV